MMTGIGNRIRAARERRGWRIRDLSTVLDTSESYVSNVERGKIVPGSDKLLAFARALETTPNDLLGVKNKEAV